MNTDAIAISQSDVRKLLGAANADAALLYIYLNSGNPIQSAASELRMNESRLSCATAVLRQLGLWEEEKKVHIAPGEPPSYTETDVRDVMERDKSFYALYEEIQRLLGRSITTEEIKILLGFVNYLGLPYEVISLLTSYCKGRAQQMGKHRPPTLYSIQKEAYFWAEQGIDTFEEATAYIQRQNLRRSRIGRLMEILQIRGRPLTAAEDRYASNWLDMGFDEEAISMAYERTCLNTGGLNWAYMNKILLRWHEAGLHTADQIRNGDQKKVPKGASGQLGEAELEAIQKILREV